MKAQPHELEIRDRRRRERSIWRTAFLLSVLFHVAIFMGWRGAVIPPSPFSAAGPRAGGDRAAPGGMRALNIRAPSALKAIPRPPVPIVATVDVKPMKFVDSIPRDMASMLGGEPGNSSSAGLPGGTGRGAGGTAASGRYRLDPPTPRGMIIPPANKNLKGTTVEVWVFVDPKGDVVPDSTRLNPPTKDSDFNKRLIQEAAEWVFRPAHRDGKAVGSWFPYKISM
jgi:hypothetical protein